MENQAHKFFFLIALPRSGNTLFASIINQNPEIVCTGNSITLEIMKELFLLKTTDTFQNFTDHKSLDNVLDNVYDLYYKDWPQKIIIDRGPVMLSGNPGNFELMQKHFKKPFKCIVLLRDLMDVLASYIQWYTDNPDSFVNKLGSNDEEKLFKLMHKEGAVAKELNATDTFAKLEGDYDGDAVQIEFLSPTLLDSMDKYLTQAEHVADKGGKWISNYKSKWFS